MPKSVGVMGKTRHVLSKKALYILYFVLFTKPRNTH